MSIRVMSWVFDHAPDDLKPSEMLTLLVLADHANEDGGLSYPSVRTLARKTRLGERTVQAALKVLMERSVIKLQMRANGPRPDVYCFPIFRGAGFAGVTDRSKEPTPAKNDTLPPQIFPKNNPTPIKENRPIKPSSLEAQAPPTKRATQIGKEWTPTEDLLAWAVANGISQDTALDETEQFVDHWTAKGETRKDWEASWRTWMRNSKKWSGSGTKTNGNGRPLNNDEKRPIPSGMPEYLSQPAKSISPDKLSELRAMRGKT